MKTLILTLVLMLSACTSKLEPLQVHVQQGSSLSHAGFYDFYLDAAAGEFKLWENQQLFEKINFAGFTATVKFYDVFPHEKWLSGLRFTLPGKDAQAELAVIDLLLKQKNNRIAFIVKSSTSSGIISEEHLFLLDEYIQFQAFIDPNNQLKVLINGFPESIQLSYKPASLQANAIGSDTHITLDIYEEI